MRIDPSDLAAFLAIARRRSFRAAPTELGGSASALSHALRALEERLDLRLVNRTTRSVALTEAGQLLFDRVAPAMGDVDVAIAELAARRDAIVGTLRLNAAHASARLELMPLLPGFLAAHPGIDVEI